MKKQFRIVVLLLMLAVAFVSFGFTGTAAEKKITLNKTNVVMKADGTIQLHLKNASGKVKWSSSKKSVAFVNASGKVTGKGVGRCVIRAIYNKHTYQCTVQVKQSASAAVLKKNSVKKNSGRILLAGSSSIARWSSAAKAFAPYEIVNMAISGTTIEQWNKWYKKMIVAYKPKAVVWYVGGNDLWKKTTPQRTAQLFIDTVKKIHKELPDTPIYFVSVYTNISRKSISKQILAYNKKIKQFCQKNDYITYVDLATRFNNSGTPLKNLLVDGLHPNAKGYKIWKDVVAGTIKNDLKQKNPAADRTENDLKQNETPELQPSDDPKQEFSDMISGVVSSGIY